MVKRKFIYILLLIVLLVVCLSGCAKVIDTETIVVDATVVDVYYRGAYTQILPTGKSCMIVHHPAQYFVTLQYEDYKIRVNNEGLYNRYKDNIGGQVECNLVTRYYDNDTTKTTLEWDGDINE